MTIANVKLIDTSRLTWQQIIEIRKDPDAIRALRKLKHFCRQEYSGKSRNEVTEDLHERIEKYEECAKNFGVDTTISTLSCLLSHKNAVAGMALLSSFVGDVPLDIATSLGVVATLGNAELQIVKARRKLKSAQFNDPVEYFNIVSKKMYK